MGVEIERKFLVKSDEWREGSSREVLKQGYLTRDKERTVRVRVAGKRAYLTIKGQRNEIARAEFEYEIPLADAAELLTMCVPSIIEKIRHEVWHGGKRWEIDEFLGANAGLIVAELELETETETFEPPPWLGDEVSLDPRYFNSQLAMHPFSQWELSE